MKIAMLIDGWDPPIFGWGQVHVKYLCEWLVKNHHCFVDLFVRKLIGEDWKIYKKDDHHGKRNIYRVWPTTKFFTIWWRLLCLFTTTIYLLWKTITQKYDIIHAHAYVSWLPAKIVWFLTRTPVIYTVHWTNCLDTKRKWLLYKLEKYLVTWIKYDLEISVSHRIFDYNNKNKNIVIIHNGVDIKKYDNIKDIEKHSGFNFIYVGRFDWQKWIEYLIEAASLLDKKILDEKKIIFNLVGDWELKNNYHLLIKKYWLQKYFVFKWKLFWEDLIKEYKRNHVFILPSLAEGQPLTLLEAMASKLPVIVTDVGDNSYFVTNKNGYIVEPENSNLLKESIENILNTDEKTIDKIKCENYTLAEKYSRENVIKDTYSKYLSVLKEK